MRGKLATTISHRAVITQDVPSHLLTLKLPAGFSLDKWVEQENARIRQMYPTYKDPAKELGREYAEMWRLARYNVRFWAERYELLKLETREELGWAKKGLADGIPFVDRRMFPVQGYEVDGYEQDALYPV